MIFTLQATMRQIHNMSRGGITSTRIQAQRQQQWSRLSLAIQAILPPLPSSPSHPHPHQTRFFFSKSSTSASVATASESSPSYEFQYAKAKEMYDKMITPRILEGQIELISESVESTAAGTVEEETPFDVKLTGIYHIPSGSKYDICLLNSADLKNQAFALLHRKYISEAKHPWNFPKQNESNIRSEKRTVNGVDNVSVLVDDFEHIAHTIGIVTPEGKVVGTIRLLHQDRMPDGRLEVERYGGVTKKHSSKLKEKRCNMEINRMAVDDCMKGKGCGTLQVFPVFTKFFAHEKYLTATMSKNLVYKLLLPRPLLQSLGRFWLLGEFKYSQVDPHPILLLLGPRLTLSLICWFNALKSGTVIIPSVLSSLRQEDDNAKEPISSFGSSSL